jgi:hypothetical protein
VVFCHFLHRGWSKEQRKVKRTLHGIFCERRTCILLFGRGYRTGYIASCLINQGFRKFSACLGAVGPWPLLLPCLRQCEYLKEIKLYWGLKIAKIYFIKWSKLIKVCA